MSKAELKKIDNVTDEAVRWEGKVKSLLNESVRLNHLNPADAIHVRNLHQSLWPEDPRNEAEQDRSCEELGILIQHWSKIGGVPEHQAKSLFEYMNT